MPGKLWRSEVEHAQTFGRHAFITYTTTSASAENALLVAGRMEEIQKISIVVDTADCYIEFDGTATTSSLLLPAGEGYSDNNLSIITNISVIRSGGTNARIRIAAWGR